MMNTEANGRYIIIKWFSGTFIYFIFLVYLYSLLKVHRGHISLIACGAWGRAGSGITLGDNLLGSWILLIMFNAMSW